MSDLEYFEKEFEPSFRVNRIKRPMRRMSLGPNILRAAASVERAKPKLQEPVKPAIADAPAQTNSAAAFARFIPDYQALISTFCERSEQLEISRLELDRIAGLASGHSGKLLSSRRPRRRFGMASLGPVLQSLGLVLIAVEDPAARAKTLALRTPFDASNRRPGNCCNPKRPDRPHRQSVSKQTCVTEQRTEQANG